MKFVRWYSAMLALVVTVVLPLSDARAGLIIDPSISTWSDQDHIDFAVSLPVSQFALFAYNADGSLGAISSAYAIKNGNNVGVKNALHSFFDGSGNMFDSFEYRYGTNFNNPDHIFTLDKSKIFAHDGGRDYAITFPNFGTVADQIQGVNVYSGPNSALDETEVIISGLFGDTGNTTTGFTGLDGNVRAGINVISSVVGDAEARSVFSRPGFSRYRDEAILVGPGDSGAPVMRLINSELFSVGLVDGGIGNGISFQGLSNFTLNDYGYDVKILNTHGGTAVPEPSSFLMLISVLCPGLFFRARK